MHLFASFGLNTFYFMSLEMGLGRAQMLCYSPLPDNSYTWIEILNYAAVVRNLYKRKQIETVN